MKVYVACPWNDRQLAKDVAADLEDHGHVITHKWWEHEGDYGTFTPEFGQECAFNDIQGVYNADRIILINSQLSEGKATELGLAIAFGIPIIALGSPSRNIFHYVPSITWVKDQDEAIEKLEENL